MNPARSYLRRSESAQSAVDVVRETLMDATDIIAPGDEPYVGWSFVLAERIMAALEASDA